MDPLTIDLDEARVTCATYQAHGQWLAFWSILALAEGGIVTADALSQYHPWSAKRSDSVGKEVARHLDRPIARDLVSSDMPTRRWSLAPAAAATRFVPSRHDVAAWLEGQRTSHHFGTWIPGLVDAVLALHDGRNDDVLAVLEGLTTSGGGSAWADTLRARAAARLGDETMPEDVATRWAARRDGGVLTRAVVARVEAARVFRDRATSDERRLHLLSRLALRVEAGGDIATLGVVLNVLGAVKRRVRGPEAALPDLRRAVGMLGLVGDYYALQGALFNLALAADALPRSGSRSPEAVHALEACLTLCERFQIARDSSQAETLAAKWAIEDDDEARAWEWLDRAAEIAARIEAEADWAFFHATRAMALRRWPRDGLDAEEERRKAIRLYEQADELVAARRLRLAITVRPANKRGG